jgi:hypothetical protein
MTVVRTVIKMLRSVEFYVISYLHVMQTPFLQQPLQQKLGDVGHCNIWHGFHYEHAQYCGNHIMTCRPIAKWTLFSLATREHAIMEDMFSVRSVPGLYNES